MNFEKVETKKDSEKTPKSMYTYAVSMIVSVFAEDEEKAKLSLNENGGFVSHRNIELKDTCAIYNPEDKD
jgi:hypothetical protein